MDSKAAAALLSGWNDILILTHRRPDGDTVGCAVGLCAALRQMGKRAYLLPNEDATALFVPYLEGYLAPEDFCWDKVVSVDVATVHLLTPRAKSIYDSQGIDLAIDHHPSNEGFARENWVESDKAACGEILFELVTELGQLTKEVAAALYLAVSTDTGCFAYTNTTSNTHAVAAELLKFDIPYKDINKRHFRTKSMRRLQLESRLLANMEVWEDGQVAMSALSLADMADIGATEVDAEDIAAFLGQIAGVKVSATVREVNPGEWKVSLRSDGVWLDACAVCALFEGGGHRAASGCTLYGSREKSLARLREGIDRVLHGT